MTRTTLSMASKPTLTTKVDKLINPKTQLREAKVVLLTFLSGLILLGCGTQSYSNYEPSAPPSPVVTQPEPSYNTNPAGVSEPESDHSQLSNDSNYGQFALTPEEIEALQKLSTLTDEEILSILPELTSEQMQYIRSFSRTPSPPQPTAIMPSNPSDDLTRSNRQLVMEMRRLNHQIEMQELRKNAEMGSPFYYYNNNP
jgi:hypothetical protein